MRLTGMLVSDYYSFTRSCICEKDNMCKLEVDSKLLSTGLGQFLTPLGSSELSQSFLDQAVDFAISFNYPAEWPIKIIKQMAILLQLQQLATFDNSTMQVLLTSCKSKWGCALLICFPIIVLACVPWHPLSWEKESFED